LQAKPKDSVMIDALIAKVHELVERRIELGPFPFPFPVVKKSGAKGKAATTGSANFSVKEILNYLESLPDADQVADLVSCALLPGAIERQTILETLDLEARLKHLIHFLMAEIDRSAKG
jgi:hypothetical protein